LQNLKNSLVSGSRINRLNRLTEPIKYLDYDNDSNEDDYSINPNSTQTLLNSTSTSTSNNIDDDAEDDVDLHYQNNTKSKEENLLSEGD